MLNALTQPQTVGNRNNLLVAIARAGLREHLSEEEINAAIFDAGQRGLPARRGGPPARSEYSRSCNKLDRRIKRQAPLVGSDEDSVAKIYVTAQGGIF